MVAETRERACLGCGVDISGQYYNVKRCASCAQERRRELARERDHHYRERQRGRMNSEQKAQRKAYLRNYPVSASVKDLWNAIRRADFGR